MSARSSSSDELIMKSPRGAARQYPPSPPLSHRSNDSDDSLRALELSDGPIAPRNARGRSYSLSGFDFQQDLLPLAASVSAADDGRAEIVGGGKDVSLLHGMYRRFDSAAGKRLIEL